MIIKYIERAKKDQKQKAKKLFQKTNFKEKLLH